jgi:hypothetical protein
MTFRITFLLLFSVCFSALQAQAPGYLGKRFLLKGDLGIVPAITGPTAANSGYGTLYGAGKTGLAFSTRFGVEASYAISRKLSVGIGGDYFKTGAILEGVFTPSVSAFAGRDNLDEHYLFYNLTGKTLDISLKSFKLHRGAIAPLGSYFAYHFSRSSIKGEVLDRRTVYALKNNKIGPLTQDPNYTLYSVGLEWGYNTLLNDRIILDFSSRINFPLGLANAIETRGISSITEEYALQNQRDYNKMVVSRLFYHSLIMVHVGIGVLLF